MKTRRVLPADVYDTLELSALAYGGIGAEWYHRYKWHPVEEQIPHCALGHAMFAGIPCDELTRAGITEEKNDAAIGDERTLISFREWCRRLNVVRGAA